jgi:hypothetical protein
MPMQHALDYGTPDDARNSMITLPVMLTGTKIKSNSVSIMPCGVGEFRCLTIDA